MGSRQKRRQKKRLRSKYKGKRPKVHRAKKREVEAGKGGDENLGEKAARLIERRRRKTSTKHLKASI